MHRLTREMTALALPAPPPRAAEGEVGRDTPAPVPSFAELYQAQFDFVWRSARRLGVREAAIEDVVQDIFVLIHRRLPTFEGRSTLRTWLYGILLRVVREHHRVSFRAGARRGDLGAEGGDERPDAGALPDEQVARAQAGRALERALDDMPILQREVFVMVELEQLTIPEATALLGEKLNTVSSRLRLARESFERSAARYRARDEWRVPRSGR